MRARADRADDLVRLGGREDELQMGRRFLDYLQQGVEARRADHVRFVDDVDLEAAARRCEERTFAQVTGVVDAAVRGRVDLYDIKAARPAPAQIHARLALPAWGRGRDLLAIRAASNH